ncbi:hypothetical protein [Cellulomonas sp. NS3]|uniref:hypothetical protein n=1 Tax=Cellulomonas sp. NS3 TaxID=2973977 RepID=UPI002162248E|nr:hypothetical protein [Cellulomonas sp. NS3]
MTTDDTTAHGATAPDAAAPEVSRRRLLRMGGMAVAGAAAATAIGSTSASAAAGDPLLAGRAHDAGTSGTRLAATSTAPTLSLANPTGAQLRLEPSDATGWNPQLGEIRNTPAGPVIGLDRDGTGVERGYLVTNLDLQDLVSYLPMIYAPAPTRVLDTRTEAGRASIVGRTPGALDASGRVVAGATIDVAVDAATGDLDAASIFVNLTVTQGAGVGYVTLFPHGVARPETSSINFTANQDLANFAVTAVGLFQGRPTIRLFVTSAVHVLVDVTAIYGSFPVTTTGAVAARSPLLPELRVDGQG